jgi:membrane-bound ClpP family serine protease
MMNISVDNSLMVKRTMTGRDAAKESKRHWTIGIGVFFSFGVMAMVMGLILAAESYIGLVIESDRVANVSAFLLIVAFPLLSLGAHCMDKVAAVQREEREANSTINS